jgi:hypothetical protein
MLMIDDFSIYIWLILLPSKDYTIDVIKRV